MAIDDGTHKIYWIDEGQDHIRSINLDGTGLTDILQSSQPLGTALEEDPVSGKIYFGSGPFGNSTSKIERINLDGTGREVIANTYAYSIFVDTLGHRVLGGDIEDRFIFEVPLDTRVRHNLFPVITPRDVQRFGDYLVFAEVSTVSRSGQPGLFSRIVRSDVDGSNRFIVREVNRDLDPADHISLFVFVPEPDSQRLTLVAAALATAARRNRR